MAQNLLFAPVSADVWEGFQIREQVEAKKDPVRQFLYARFDVRNELFASLDIDTNTVATLMVLEDELRGEVSIPNTSTEAFLLESGEKRQKRIDGFFNRDYQEG